MEFSLDYVILSMNFKLLSIDYGGEYDELVFNKLFIILCKTRKLLVYTQNSQMYANQGIGLEICKQLASKGVYLVFHQLDVLDPSSISSLVDFVKSEYGKLDILVNNAGILGLSVDTKAIEALAIRDFVINVWACNILNDTKPLSEERIDEILEVFLKDLKEGCLESKKWPSFLSAYTLSKAAMNAYTRLFAEKHPNYIINSVCPGWVKTNLSLFTGPLNVEEGARSVVRLALLPEHSGLFFYRDEVTSF
ncbi:hypothetical protein L1987_39247 [Smallanthus sonchifolius]|uniref:Uncharacterized protein n=1 Tax=Smallanthus sonchifolius TaxID=185202 RepID=A0ACB9HKU8_9ASTR|nr:hypothetical protein L1987_39247 [Smallanthus sonchifolius]